MDRTEQNLDRVGLNPAGAARRRLIKALGLGAVAANLSLDWTQPQVRLGSVPAHAQGTVDNAEGCAVGYTLELSAPAPFGAFTYLISAGDGTDFSHFQSTTFTDSTAVHTIEGSSFQGTSEAWTWGYNFSVDGTVGARFTNSYQCCTDTGSYSASGDSSTTNNTNVFAAITGDDGACVIES